MPMIVTLSLPSEVELAYRAEAEARGVSMDELMLEVLVANPPLPSRAELSVEERVRRFEAWIDSHAADDLPVLSDEAISREFIYRDRGL
jgi:hypothetical protein